MDSSSPRHDDLSTFTTDDLSALAWVHDELRRSLEAAHKALRRFIRDTETTFDADLDAVDPAVLRTARQQFHQGVGALELVGLPAAATVLRASEAAVQRSVSKGHKLNGQIVGDIEHASFALLDYLSRVLAGRPVSPLAMFPQYRAVQEAAGAERVHPADLWTFDWQWRELPADAHAHPREPNAATRSALEQLMLVLMRNPSLAAYERMSEVCADLGAGAAHLQTATLWKLAAAVFEAQAQQLLQPDVFSKRLASRLLAQLRGIERGEAEVSERLAQDLLFFCAQAASPGDGSKAPRLAAVRQAYGLVRHTPVDYGVSALGRFDPALVVQARKRVGAAKESWSAVAGGEAHRIAGLVEQFALTADSLKRLFPSGERLAAELQAAATQTQDAGDAPPPELAMEVATGLLFVDACLEDGDFDHAELPARVQALAGRIAQVRQGAPAAPLESWMEDVYRRVSDRQTMGSVVQELRVSLSEAEKLIDQFFRHPTQRDVLIPVPGQLAAMRGVLSVLGMDHASAALARMRADVEGLVSTELLPEHVAQVGVFDRLAGNLGALGFLIDMLSVQPQLAKSVFAYDAESGTLNPIMGRGRRGTLAAEAPPHEAPPRLIEQAQMLALTAAQPSVPIAEVSRDLAQLSQEAQAAELPQLSAAVAEAQSALEHAHGDADLAQARERVSEMMVDFVSSTHGADAQDSELPSVAAAAAPASMPAELGDDAEMREIFLEEAREVLDGAGAALAQVSGGSGRDDIEALTTLRRAFHTLKGSARMVGLKDFGEAAWVCEQLYNAKLAEQSAAEPALIDFTRWALDHLGAWVQEIADGGRREHGARVVQQAAQALREGPAAAPASAPVPAPAPAVAVPPVPPLSIPERPPVLADVPMLPAAPAPAAEPVAAPAAVEPVTAPPAVEALPEFAFELDLAALDAAWAAPAPAAPAADPAAPVPLPAAAEQQDLAFETLDFDFSEPDETAELLALEPVPVPVPEPEPAPESPAAMAHTPPPDSAVPPPEDVAPALDEQIKQIGPLRIGIPLFNIYLNEADELSRRLTIELAEWAMELHEPVSENAIALAHSLAGNSATVGFADLSQLARLLEHALTRSRDIGRGTPEEGRLFSAAAEDIRRLLHQFAAGFLKQPSPELLQALADHELSSARRLERLTAPGPLDARAPAAAEPVPPPVAAEPAPAPPPVPPVAEPVPVAVPAPVAAAEPESAPESAAEPDSIAVASVVERPLSDSELASLHEMAARDTNFGAPLVQLDTPEPAALKPLAELPLEPALHAVRHAAPDADDSIDAVDAIDAELFPFFEEEGQELLPELSARLHDWARQPGQAKHAESAMRTLHTLKGGARLAGAMRLGEMAHRLESQIEHVAAMQADGAAGPADLEALLARSDALSHAFEALRAKDAQAYADAVASADQAAPPVPDTMAQVALPPSPTVVAAAEPAPVAAPPVVAAVPSAAPQPAPQPSPQPSPPRGEGESAPPAIDWARFAGATTVAAAEKAAVAQSAVRVRAPLLDRMVNQAGEVIITRSRIEAEVGQIRSSLADLTQNLDRMRQQLRDIELQAELQMTSRMEAAKVAAEAFDPLEIDRFTRFQELTRMMAESVNDVATVQRALQRTLANTEDELVAQTRLTRDLQDDLLRTRMLEFDSLSDRLYRVVRQAAKETGKQVRLDIVGGSIEVDRGVLDRVTGALEHLVRNSVTHGIEPPEARLAAKKDAAGQIVVTVTQEGNEVGVEVRDDGQGLALARIRARGQALGLVARPGDGQPEPSDAELANLIFLPGFSTAERVSELAGRGVGMDVVRSDVVAMGGRIETATSAGQGTSFRLVLPLTTAVTQVVMLRCGEIVVAVPSTLVEIVRRALPGEIDAACVSGSFNAGTALLPFFWLGALLQAGPRSLEFEGRTRHVVIVRSASQRVALHVDEVLGNHEVVVKNLGPQLSRIPGLTGMTLLASGRVALIYNPVALASLYGAAARAATHAAMLAPAAVAPAVAAAQSADAAAGAAPLVMVVDDSLTVRRITQRLLAREGYRVVVAKDGLDALERLADETPALVFSDIEMPRMDGFDLVRNIRGDARWRELPVVMISSRMAQKHRDHAALLGVNHYLGKPYSEEDLLALVSRYTAQAERAPA